MRIVFITTGLEQGGAETVLHQILSGIDRKQFEPVVVSLKAGGVFVERFERSGVPVTTANMKPGLPTPASLWRLYRIIRALKPDILQGWMYHGNFMASLCGMFIAKNAPVFWSIHNSLYNVKHERRGTQLVIRLLAKLSQKTQNILYVANTTAKQHEALGFAKEKTFVVPNGFNLERFAPDRSAAERIRKEFNIPDSTRLIGSVGRWDAHKDFGNFIKAAKIVREKNKNVHFLLVGKGLDHQNPELTAMLQSENMTDAFLLSGPRTDIPDLMNAMDIFVSSSRSEAFPMVVGEAMCTETPCVVTDVGDSARVVGDSGIVVPSLNSEKLAKGIQLLLNEDTSAFLHRGTQARRYIENNFSKLEIVRIYQDLYCKAELHQS